MAVASMNQGPLSMIINEAMKQNVMPSASDIIKGRVQVNDIKIKVEEGSKKCRCKRRENVEK